MAGATWSTWFEVRRNKEISEEPELACVWELADWTYCISAQAEHLRDIKVI